MSLVAEKLESVSAFTTSAMQYKYTPNAGEYH